MSAVPRNAAVDAPLNVDVDGLRWAVRVAGSGPALLLLHGFTGSGRSWDGWLTDAEIGPAASEIGPAAAAIGAGFSMIAPDLPGHAGTAWLANDPATRRAGDPAGHDRVVEPAALGGGALGRRQPVVAVVAGEVHLGVVVVADVGTRAAGQRPQDQQAGHQPGSVSTHGPSSSQSSVAGGSASPRALRTTPSASRMLQGLGRNPARPRLAMAEVASCSL